MPKMAALPSTPAAAYEQILRVNINILLMGCARAAATERI
jgi:hypothetical protein